MQRFLQVRFPAVGQGCLCTSGTRERSLANFEQGASRPRYGPNSECRGVLLARNGRRDRDLKRIAGRVLSSRPRLAFLSRFSDFPHSHEAKFSSSMLAPWHTIFYAGCRSCIQWHSHRILERCYPSVQAPVASSMLASCKHLSMLPVCWLDLNAFIKSPGV